MSWEPLDISNPDADEVIGDGPFDEMAATIEKIAEIYKAELGRLPTINEMVTTFKQALETRIDETTKEGEDHELLSIKFRLKKIPKRQKYKEGDVLRAKLANGEYVFGRLFVIDMMGPRIGVYDSKGMDSKDIDTIIKKPLIVKITPIHYENMQDRREWEVIDHREIKEDELKNPFGPGAISGTNDQLIAANYYYGLSDEKYYDIDKWIIKKE